MFFRSASATQRNTVGGGGKKGRKITIFCFSEKNLIFFLLCSLRAGKETIMDSTNILFLFWRREVIKRERVNIYTQCVHVLLLFVDDYTLLFLFLLLLRYFSCDEPLRKYSSSGEPTTVFTSQNKKYFLPKKVIKNILRIQ